MNIMQYVLCNVRYYNFIMKKMNFVNGHFNP